MEQQERKQPLGRRDKLWHRFSKTGKVEDYLRYANEDAEFAEEPAPGEEQKDTE